jgi:hypothetical protein
MLAGVRRKHNSMALLEKKLLKLRVRYVWCIAGLKLYAAIAVIAVEGEQNAVDHCGNDGV